MKWQQHGTLVAVFAGVILFWHEHHFLRIEFSENASTSRNAQIIFVPKITDGMNGFCISREGFIPAVEFVLNISYHFKANWNCYGCTLPSREGEFSDGSSAIHKAGFGYGVAQSFYNEPAFINMGIRSACVRNDELNAPSYGLFSIGKVGSIYPTAPDYNSWAELQYKRSVGNLSLRFDCAQQPVQSLFVLAHHAVLEKANYYECRSENRKHQRIEIQLLVGIFMVVCICACSNWGFDLYYHTRRRFLAVLVVLLGCSVWVGGFGWMYCGDPLWRIVWSGHSDCSEYNQDYQSSQHDPNRIDDSSIIGIPKKPPR